MLSPLVSGFYDDGYRTFGQCDEYGANDGYITNINECETAAKARGNSWKGESTTTSNPPYCFINYGARFNYKTLAEVEDSKKFCSASRSCICKTGCKRCNIGHSSPGGEVTECTKCETGKYNDEVGQSECKLCAGGKYNALEAQTDESACLWCPAGRFSKAGWSNCTVCESGKFSLIGAAECVPFNLEKISKMDQNILQLNASISSIKTDVSTEILKNEHLKARIETVEAHINGINETMQEELVAQKAKNANLTAQIFLLKNSIQLLTKQYESIHSECKANWTSSGNGGRRLGVACGRVLEEATSAPTTTRQPTTTVAPTTTASASTTASSPISTTSPSRTTVLGDVEEALDNTGSNLPASVFPFKLILLLTALCLF